MIRALPTSAENGYHYADRERIESLITKNTRAILITNPGNPTGVVLSEEEMRMIADIAKKYDLYLICDEVYREFCYDDSRGVPSMGRFDDIADNLVMIDSVSKRFSACGARIGCVVTKNRELQDGAAEILPVQIVRVHHRPDRCGGAVQRGCFLLCKEQGRVPPPAGYGGEAAAPDPRRTGGGAHGCFLSDGETAGG